MELKKTTGSVWAAVGILIFWYIAAVFLDIAFLPDPITVLVNTAAIFSELWHHILYSLWRIVAGLGISLIFGVTIGVAMGRCPRFDALASPLVYLLYPVPKIAFLPLVMLICGLGEVAKITIIVLIVVFQVIVAVRDAVKAIPPEKFWGLQVLGANSLDILGKVTLPASLPSIISGMRVSLGTALSVLFFTETFGTTYGLGYFIMDSFNRINYVDMFSGIVTLGILGFLLFFLIDLAAKRCCH